MINKKQGKKTKNHQKPAAAQRRKKASEQETNGSKGKETRQAKKNRVAGVKKD